MLKNPDPSASRQDSHDDNPDLFPRDHIPSSIAIGIAIGIVVVIVSLGKHGVMRAHTFIPNIRALRVSWIRFSLSPE
jgi:hypothetical protein